MITDILDVGEGGARLTVYGAIDEWSAFYVGLAIFLALVLALAVYAKVLR